ncbi:hypothetical protein [Streptomyces flaveolus]|uniref:hypothetical protein n=1 Tax=Streptomyces flaveolus TaxID=67297 RepID=UPI0033D886DE
MAAHDRRVAASAVQDVLDDGTVHIRVQPNSSLELDAAHHQLVVRTLIAFADAARPDTQISSSL